MKSIWKIIAVSALSCALTQSALGQNVNARNCPGPNIRSMESNFAINLSFFNDSPVSQDIYWLDFDGRLIFYRTLFPGEAYVQPTFGSHAWVVWEGDHCNFWTSGPMENTDINIR